MADKEIGLVQIRTGKQRNLPTALELGEMAMTTDECRLFVGLPSVILPASLVAGRTKVSVPGSSEENVEVLTEFTPNHVLSRVLYRAVKLDIPASTWNVGVTSYTTDLDTITTMGTFLLSIPTADRLFIDYTAYSLNEGTKILETGSIQIIAIDGGVLLTQTNNTSDANSNIWVSADAPYTSGSSTKIILKNRLNIPIRFEYIYRGWQEPI